MFKIVFVCITLADYRFYLPYYYVLENSNSEVIHKEAKV